MTFSEFKAHSEPLFKQLGIRKFVDNIELSNSLFVYDFLQKNLPESYSDTFTRLDDGNVNCPTRQASKGMLFKPLYNSTTFGLKCIYKRCIDSWNRYTTNINQENQNKYVNKLKCPDIDLSNFTRNKLKLTLTNHILSLYEE